MQANLGQQTLKRFLEASPFMRFRLMKLNFVFPLCVLAILPMSAFGQSWFGVLRGVTRDSATGRPLPDAKVFASRVDEASERHTVSGKDGSFLIRVAPGIYEVTATKDGFLPTVANCQVTELVVNRLNLSLRAEKPAPDVEPAPSALNRRISSGVGFEKLPQLVAANIPAAVPIAPAAGGTTGTILVSVPKPETNPNLAVLKELQSLRKRIEQLEGELNKPQDSASAPAIAVPISNSASSAPFLMADPTLPSLTPTSGEASPSAGPAPSLPAPVTAQQPPPVEAKSSVPVSPNPIDMQTPFADYDWTWLNGNARTKDSPLDSKYFTGEFRADTHYGEDFNQPIDHSMGGSSEVFRNNEVQLEQISLGGDLHVGNVRGRILTLFGMFAQTTPRNDASVAVGQWDARTLLSLSC